MIVMLEAPKDEAREDTLGWNESLFKANDCR